MNNCLTTIALSLLPGAGALFLASPATAQTVVCFDHCYLVWHEVCVVTPNGAECEGSWRERCDFECWLVP